MATNRGSRLLSAAAGAAGGWDTVQRQTNPHGVRTALILDDEPGIVELTALFLSGIVHTIVQCTSVQSAMEQFQRTGGVDLLIVDLTLGDASGVEAAIQLKALRPGLKVLFMSGYSLDEWNVRDRSLLKAFPRESVRVLQKPFTRRTR